MPVFETGSLTHERVLAVSILLDQEILALMRGQGREG